MNITLLVRYQTTKVDHRGLSDLDLVSCISTVLNNRFNLHTFIVTLSNWVSAKDRTSDAREYFLTISSTLLRQLDTCNTAEEELVFFLGSFKPALELHLKNKGFEKETTTIQVAQML